MKKCGKHRACKLNIDPIEGKNPSALTWWEADYSAEKTPQKPPHPPSQPELQSESTKTGLAGAQDISFPPLLYLVTITSHCLLIKFLHA